MYLKLVSSKVPVLRVCIIFRYLSQDLATKYDVTAMPTIVLFKGGAEVGRVVGANLDQIKEMVETKSK